MFTRKINGMAVAASLLIAAGSLVFAGQGAMGAQEKDQSPIKKAPMTYTKPDSGAEMFKEYCAVCHGPDGRGDGPAVEFLKAPPPNLRTLAKRNNGKYPDMKVSGVLHFGSENKAHGTSDMPLWGRVFSTAGGRNIASMRIYNLTEHIKTLQDK